MGNLLDQSASGTCSHGDSATPIAGNQRVAIGGVPVLTVLSQLSHAGCPNNPTGVSPLPCVTAMYPMGATRVTVMNMALLLDSSTPNNVPTGVSTTITRTQMRVKGL